MVWKSQAETSLASSICVWNGFLGSNYIRVHRPGMLRIMVNKKLAWKVKWLICITRNLIEIL